MTGARVFVDGHAYDDPTRDCRTKMCRHNENTDMIAWRGALWLVHRTAISQTLGPNSALHVYESTDGGATFREAARLPAPTDGVTWDAAAGDRPARLAASGASRSTRAPTARRRTRTAT